jgi:large subunit ribosomal protein L18e
MTKPTGPTNVHTRLLIDKLNKTKVPIWKDVADKLNSPRRNKVEVNVSDIDKIAEKGQTVVVPGIVLGSGDMKKDVKVAAFKFAGKASAKIKDAKGAAMSIEELLEKNPKGSNVRIMV